MDSEAPMPKKKRGPNGHQKLPQITRDSLDGRTRIAHEYDSIVDGISAPGKRVAFRAETDILVLVSNCPQMNNPCNDFNPTPLRMIVTAGHERHGEA